MQNPAERTRRFAGNESRQLQAISWCGQRLYLQLKAVTIPALVPALWLALRFNLPEK
jgi:hypothetical protein